MEPNRRDFGKLVAITGAATLFAPNIARAAAQKLVVVGGGPGGATVAKYAAKDSKGAIEVTLVEQNPLHTTCFFSNLYLGDFWDLDKLSHGYDAMRGYGVDVIHQRAKSVETGKVTLADGSTLMADRVVVAPGIDFKFDLYEGYDEHIAATRIPHAYKAGPQTQLLKKQIEAMPEGGTFIICPPPNPFRCPPGPYERVSMVASMMKKKNPSGKILILDAKDKHSKMALFQEAWERHTPGMVEFVPAEFTGGGIASIDAKNMTVTTLDDETFEGDVINMIPAQKAGQIAIDSGLTGDGDWASVDPVTMESTLVEGVHVLGDACANGDMPKSGFSANSQAKVVANQVRAAMGHGKAFPPRFRNTCWSLLGADDGVKVGADYKSGDDKITKTEGFISQVGEDEATRAATASEAVAWYKAISEDVWA
jgi:NADPH-dependent 2,4-dienoyl-CoA reductase/sulfur reductase-like enzyme